MAELEDFDRRVSDLHQTQVVYDQIVSQFPDGASTQQRADLADKVLGVLQLLLHPDVKEKRKFEFTAAQIKEIQAAVSDGKAAFQQLQQLKAATSEDKQRRPLPAGPGAEDFEFSEPERRLGPVPEYSHDENLISFPMFAEEFRLHRELCYIRRGNACLLLKKSMKGKAKILTAHIDPRNYKALPDGFEALLLVLQGIFLPSSESSLMLARFHSATQGKRTISEFHGVLRYLYSCAYPNLKAADLEISTQLIHHFRNNLTDLNIQRQVIRANPTTYQDALITAQREESTNLIVAVNSNPVLKSALGQGATSTQLAEQASGTAAGQTFGPAATAAAAAPAQVNQTLWTAHPATTAPVPMDLGSLQGQPGKDKCFYCPDKPSNHRIERCWRIRTAIRQHFGPDFLPEALGRPGQDSGHSRMRGRGNAAPRGRGTFHNRGRGSRPEWKDVGAKIAALLDNLDIESDANMADPTQEPGEDPDIGVHDGGEAPDAIFQ